MKKLILITVLCLFTLQCEQGWIKDIIVPPVEGCTDSNSCNYNSEAEDDDGSCIAKQGCNEWCEGDAGIVLELDCQGNCGGSNYIDNCGICVLNSTHACTQDCFGNWGGNGELDNCGNCIGEINPFQCELDCAGVWGGTAVVDACDTCGGSITDTAECDCDNEDEVRDCAGVCGGTAVEDCAGVCGGTAVDTDGNGICDSDETVYGCTTPSACNFDATATIFDDSCWSATEGCECADGAGAVKDNCGTCDTDTSNDCGWKVQYTATSRLLDAFFIDSNTGWAVGYNGLIIKTIDGGTNWSAQSSGTSYRLEGVHFVDSSIGWVVGTEGTILATTNGGDNWSVQDYNATCSLYKTNFSDANTGWAVTGCSTIIATTNGGSDWITQPCCENYLTDIQFIDSNTGWAVGYSIIAKTTDGGSNWATQSIGSSWLKGVHFIDSSNGWVVSSQTNTILATTDGGSNWTTQTCDCIIPNGLEAVSFYDASTGWAVGGDGFIIKTTDGGDNWSAQNSGIGGNLFAVQFVESNIGWAVGNYNSSGSIGVVLKYVE